ncbi:hypothetical protein K458DRAFT_416942 [Lentithecium fluviatile CBS 122367]|uniref:Uncharacterized protein n=1 Tax=Lentithecium fluviatile CBS 122367 TaxID=1168545 RepID=A0A6G1J695_9PLEO|nr:hypothetical protein K458DRAFT_416942 [Lentithecium fluviatile CBS 122367]
MPCLSRPVDHRSYVAMQRRSAVYTACPGFSGSRALPATKANSLAQFELSRYGRMAELATCCIAITAL